MNVYIKEQRITRCSVYDNDYNFPGRFMITNFTFGSKGDEAVLNFAVPSLNNRRSLNFLYISFGENKGHLQVHTLSDIRINDKDVYNNFHSLSFDLF